MGKVREGTFVHPYSLRRISRQTHSHLIDFYPVKAGWVRSWCLAHNATARLDKLSEAEEDQKVTIGLALVPMADLRLVKGFIVMVTLRVVKERQRMLI